MPGGALDGNRDARRRLSTRRTFTSTSERNAPGGSSPGIWKSGVLEPLRGPSEHGGAARASASASSRARGEKLRRHDSSRSATASGVGGIMSTERPKRRSPRKRRTPVRNSKNPGLAVLCSRPMRFHSRTPKRRPTSRLHLRVQRLKLARDLRDDAKASFGSQFGSNRRLVHLLLRERRLAPTKIAHDLRPRREGLKLHSRTAPFAGAAFHGAQFTAPGCCSITSQRPRPQRDRDRGETPENPDRQRA